MKPDPTSLDLLHDVVAPPPVPWWPPAPGWYWVLSALAVLLLVALARGFLHWQRNRYRREALAEWRRQERLLADPAQRASALVSLAVLLKRTALSAFPRPEVAALTGRAWFVFLDRTGAGTAFHAGMGAILENAAYDPRSVAKLDEKSAQDVAQIVHHWIRDHRRGGAL